MDQSKPHTSQSLHHIEEQIHVYKPMHVYTMYIHVYLHVHVVYLCYRPVPGIIRYMYGPPGQKLLNMIDCVSVLSYILYMYSCTSPLDRCHCV